LHLGNTPEGTGMVRKRDVWNEATAHLRDFHFASFPKSIVEPCVLATTENENDIVLDPFCGSGTVGVVANNRKRKFIGIELYPKFVKIAKKRIKTEFL
jgi:site-specific DNA-methyltransferase (cytosine-N4-specific)